MQCTSEILTVFLALLFTYSFFSTWNLAECSTVSATLHAHVTLAAAADGVCHDLLNSYIISQLKLLQITFQLVLWATAAADNVQNCLLFVMWATLTLWTVTTHKAIISVDHWGHQSRTITANEALTLTPNLILTPKPNPSQKSTCIALIHRLP